MNISDPQRRPIIFAVLLYLVTLVTFFFAGAVTIRLKLPTLAIYLIGYPVLALMAILLVSRWHWWREAGFRLPSNPLPYLREGDVVTVFTSHSWWKNVRGGAKVAVEMKRQRLGGIAEAISDDRAAIATSLLAFLRKHPSQARWYHVPVDAAGQPNPEAVQQAAHFLVMVRIHPSGGPPAL